uniref:NADH-ubiquinone oxidoreductase chain 2 n=1 Tax=Cylindrus obtusus TaxID=649475 RepID=I1T1X9_9EUPU|nr:NADH dehydrogenase subunit 2 [Cylindrus obtusus]AEK48359.1 NADH dehydrogenase subunit 2 [Cylindrus obtusus]
MVSVVFLGLMLTMSVVVGLMVSNWFLIVLLMEVGLLTVVFMCFDYKLLSQVSACVKYFLIQSLSSMLLFLIGLLVVFYSELTFLSHMLFVSAMSLKLGVAPLHFWVLPTTRLLPYTLIGIIGSPLKILPLCIFSGYYSFHFAVGDVFWVTTLWLSLYSMLTGMFLGLGATSLREALGASSITHTGWFLLSFQGGSTISYFILYSISLLQLVVFLLSQSSYLISMSLLGLGGLPPFSIFVGKLAVLYSCLSGYLSFGFLIPVVVTSAISLYYYMKFSFLFYLSSHHDGMRFSYPSLLFVGLNMSLGFCVLLFFYGRVGNSFLIYARI